jgi:trehalose-phosphatase
MRTTLQHLAEKCPLAVISGRDLADVRERVGISGIYYAGSHGFDIAGPEGQNIVYEKGSEFLPELDTAETQLHAALDHIPGCQVERKRFAIAVHYRRAQTDQLNRIKHVINNVQSEHSRLRLSTGKKIFELQPDIDWNKGKALQWLMQAMQLDKKQIIPLYIGDDVTDEHAFKVVKETGVGILVAEQEKSTAAGYRLRNTSEVQTFLNTMTHKLQSAEYSVS